MKILILLSGMTAFALTSLWGASEKDRTFAYRSFWPEFGAMQNFKNAGVNTYAIKPSNTYNSLGEPYCKYPPVWVWKETYVWENLDKQFDDIIAVNPQARFICIVDINSPLWLQRILSYGHPVGSDSFSEISNSVCIRDWRILTGKYFAEYIKHVESKYGDRVTAYMIAAGGTDEWMDMSFGLADMEKTREWRAWLKKRGKDEVAAPRQEDLLKASFENRIRDPQKERVIIDYAQFTGDVIADAVEDFAKTARAIVGDKKQIGAFFGYVLILGRRDMVWAGHLEYERLFASPYLDFFASPGAYDNRLMGMGSGFQSPDGTRARYGKNWFHEIDHRTHTFNSQLSPYIRIPDQSNCKTQAETDACLKREFSLATVCGTSLWCFDMWGGVFSTPETMKIVGRGREIWEKYKNATSPLACEIALIVDPQSARYLNGSEANFVQPYMYSRKQLNTIGAPFQVFSFNDIGHADLSKYKMIVFPSSPYITPERYETLKKYVFKNGKTAVFADAFGITDGENLDTSRVAKYTGFEYGIKGLNKKNMGDWNSVYVRDVKSLDSATLRKIAEEAGVHIYVDGLSPIFSNENLVCVHVKDGGQKSVSLPKKCAKVTELYTGKVVAENTDEFEYDFKTPDTALFELQY